MSWVTPEQWLGQRVLRSPVGLINGSMDPVSGEHMVQRFEELIGRERFVHRLPTVGHYPQVEAPEAVLQAYTEFLPVAIQNRGLSPP